MFKYMVPLFAACSVVCAAETDPMAEACERLLRALEQEVVALEGIQTPEDAPAAVEELRASLLAQEDLFAVDARELWQYIDNTAGAKQPLVDMMVRLAVQFGRLTRAEFFGNDALRELLAPQLVADESVRKAKLEKVRTIDHDED